MLTLNKLEHKVTDKMSFSFSGNTFNSIMLPSTFTTSFEDKNAKNINRNMFQTNSCS